MTRICIKCKNGALVSICANEYAYCEPRDNRGPYTQVEVGLWTEPIEAMKEYAETGIENFNNLTVYPYLPVELLGQLIAEYSK